MLIKPHQLLVFSRLLDQNEKQDFSCYLEIKRPINPIVKSPRYTTLKLLGYGMNPNSKVWLCVVLLAIIGGLAIIHSMSGRDPMVPKQAPATTAPPSSTARASEVPARLASAAMASSPTLTNNAVNINAQVAGLLSEGNGAGLLAAHQIVAQCLTIERLRREGFRNPQVDKIHDERLKECSELAYSYRRDYLSWLKRAIDQKVPGAAILFLSAGPNGNPDDLQFRASDPIVVEWKKTAIDYLIQAARNGEAPAALTLAQIYSTDAYGTPDAALDIGYMMAMQELRRKNNQPVSEAISNHIKEKFKNLPPEEQARARLAASQILN